MAISIRIPVTEKRLERIAASREPRSNKRALAVAILDRASRMKSGELHNWLNDSNCPSLSGPSEVAPLQKPAANPHGSDSAREIQEASND